MQVIGEGSRMTLESALANNSMLIKLGTNGTTLEDWAR